MSAMNKGISQVAQQLGTADNHPDDQGSVMSQKMQEVEDLRTFFTSPAKSKPEHNEWPWENTSLLSIGQHK
jgi:hypothetical protein